MPNRTNAMTRKLRIVVVGAGTGVGKTHVGCALAAELVRRGVVLEARKPIESGYLPEGSDADLLARSAGHNLLTPRYAFDEAVSPHLAARHAGLAVELAEVVSWCATSGDLLVETAGGLLSPVSATCTNLDIAAALEPSAIVLVAVNRLGALHDVRVCQLALGERGLSAQVVLCHPEAADAGTPSNVAELAFLGWAPGAIAFPRAPLGDARTHMSASLLADALERRR